MKNISEKLSYLVIEVLAGEGTPESNLLIEKRTLEFRKEFPKSLHTARITYLLGMAYLANKNEVKGKEVFKSLLKDKDVPEYIKGLVRTELSLLKIKEKVI